jgi:hypothetical protein
MFIEKQLFHGGNITSYGQSSLEELSENQRVRTRAAAAISIPAAPTPMAVTAIK